MLRIFVSLLAVLPTLLPPGMCVCQFVPQTSVQAVKATETPRRHCCSCCRAHPERTVADSSTRKSAPAHGWNEPREPHDSSCPVVHGTPMPRLANLARSQLVMAVGILAIDGVHLHTMSLDWLPEPRHTTRIPAHLGFRVLQI
jgi:hypothetical protein